MTKNFRTRPIPLRSLLFEPKKNRNVSGKLSIRSVWSGKGIFCLASSFLAPPSLSNTCLLAIDKIKFYLLNLRPFHVLSMKSLPVNDDDEPAADANHHQQCTRFNRVGYPDRAFVAVLQKIFRRAEAEWPVKVAGTEASPGNMRLPLPLTEVHGHTGVHLE